MQASTSLKDAFLSVSKSTTELEGASSTSSGIPEELGENPKKKARLVGPVCNAAASCNSKANYKNDATKTFFCREHYELLAKPARKSLVKLK